MKHDVDYFIKKFSAIPDNLWITYSRSNGQGGHCAHGWCDVQTVAQYSGSFGKMTEEEKGLIDIATKYFTWQPLYSLPERVSFRGFAYINNAPSDRYPQTTPKARVLAALEDIKRQQEIEETNSAVEEVKQILNEQILEEIM